MHDPRIDQLAEVLIGYSTQIKKGDRVLIEVFDAPETIAIALVRAVSRKGGLPFAQVHRSRLTRELIAGATEEQASVQGELELARIRKMQAYVAVRGAENIFEMSDVPGAANKLWSAKMKAAWDHRVKETKWVVLRWPTASMAQQAQMATGAFEDFFFRVCTLDYARMQPGMAALKRLMESTDRVHIKGPGTDLRFSIRGIRAVACGGRRNIPDGEVFTAPVKESVEGEVSFNAPTVYQGSSFDGIRLKFSQGRIVDAAGSNTRRLNEILDTDAGSRFVGEFALGFNPHILHPMRDILFDEKIAGSFHFTPGQCYEETENGNRSTIHWDMVSIQRPDYGGGEIWFDGKLVRQDGLFLPAALRKLNPEHLLGGRR